MALINPNITLDTKRKYTDTIFLTQGEYGARALNFVLLHGGVAIDLTGCTVNFLAKKPSGALLTNACVLTTPANGKFTYTVTQQTSIEAGALTDARIEVIKTGVLLRSFKINVVVEAVPDYTTAVESTNEFTALAALSGQIAQIGTLSALLTTAKTSLVAAINELFGRALIVKTTTQTYISPATGGSLTLVRCGNTVQMYAWASHASIPTSPGYLWNWIPVGYRPTQALDRVIGTAWTASSVYTGYVPAVVTIGTDGSVTIAATVASKIGCAVNASWITNDAMPT